MQLNKILTGLAVLLSLSSAYAGTGQVADQMQDIKELFNGISESVADKSQDKVNAEKALQLVTLFTEVQSQVPDTISALPVEKRA